MPKFLMKHYIFVFLVLFFSLTFVDILILVLQTRILSNNSRILIYLEEKKIKKKMIIAIDLDEQIETKE